MSKLTVKNKVFAVLEKTPFLANHEFDRTEIGANENTIARTLRLMKNKGIVSNRRRAGKPYREWFIPKQLRLV